MDAATHFLERVLPWPGDENSPGYVNIHWKGRNAAEGYPGKPYRSATDAMNYARWALEHFQSTPDLYFCLSLQGSKGTSQKTGRDKAIRSKQNVISLKSFWVDIDVKEPPKGYATLEEAAIALKAFIAVTGLPTPSAVVKSGGGLHVYWITTAPMTLDEWRPIAEGLAAAALKHELRCDTQCTVDAVRILRIPDTFNCKTEPKRPVKLLTEGAEYDRAVIASAVAGYSQASQPAVSASATVAAALFPVRDLPAKYQGIEKASAGITRDEITLDTKAIIKGCPFLNTALRTGGKDMGQPEWNLTTLISTFLEEGDAIAHAMGNRHSEYNVESTNALLDRKKRERAEKGLGWPSCRSIQSAGYSGCASCPHLGQNKTPLHLGLTKPVNVFVPGPTPQNPLDLPEGYALDKQGRIAVMLYDKESGETREEPLFENIFTNPWAQASERALHFTTTADLGRTNPVMLEATAIHGMDMFKQLYGAGVSTIGELGRKYAGRFFMAWLSRIEKKKVSMITRAFGWEMSGDTPKGFVFGDRAYRVDGSTAPCGYKDPQMRQAYEPAGDLSVWLEASRFVTDQKRPELEVFLASAFAAPLTIFGGQHGCLLSIYGTTGGGKSTTLKIAQAVWGRPNKARQVLSSTENALSNILGKLANLPLYWDEIKEDHNYKKLTTMVFSVSMGKEKDRMHGDGSLRQPGEWHTLMGATMNACFTDYLTRTGKTDAAGLARVFEYRVEKKNDITGSGKHYDVDAMVGRLEYNHGGMGVAYAKMLVERAAQLQDLIITEGKAFDKLVNANQEERYWSKFCATTLVGAKFANELGCEFHLDSMRDFLVGIFMEMRGIISSEATQNNDSIEEMLTLFFKEYIDCILVTDTFVKHGGKVLKGMVKVISSPSQQHPKGVQIQWVAQDPLGDNKLLISLPTFHDWLDKRGRSRREAFRGLHHMYGAQKAQRTLGGGTTWAMGKERVYEMDVVHGSPLWVILKEKLGESRGALLVPVTPSDTPSDTTPTLAVA